MRARIALILAAAGLSLGGCAYGDLGLGMGYGDPYGYGYGGPYGGYGAYPGYYGGFGYGGYGGYGYDPFGYGGYGYDPFGYGGYGMGGFPYYGWYDNYYYPGSGIYVYDQYRQPHVWTSTQRTYWTQRLAKAKLGQKTAIRENWSGFTRPRAITTTTVVRGTPSLARVERQQARSEARQQREQVRIERRIANEDTTTTTTDRPRRKH